MGPSALFLTARYSQRSDYTPSVSIICGWYVLASLSSSQSCPIENVRTTPKVCRAKYVKKAVDCFLLLFDSPDISLSTNTSSLLIANHNCFPNRFPKPNQFRAAKVTACRNAHDEHENRQTILDCRGRIKNTAIL